MAECKQINLGASVGGRGIWFWGSYSGASGSSLNYDWCQVEGGGSSGVFSRTVPWCGS